jgi:hypothetical protein
MLMSDAHGQDLPGPLEPAAPKDTMPGLVGYIVNRLFSIGLSLESARSIVGDGPAGDRIGAATDKVDRLIREVRQHVFAEHQQEDQEHPAQTADRAALLQEHMARTARALQASAADYAALLEQKADLTRTRQPQRMDYPAEIKRWRAFADQAEQMAKCWEQRP